MQCLDWKHDFWIGNNIFRLETQFLDCEHNFILLTRFLDWKQNIEIGNTIFRLKTQFLDWKQDF